MGAIQNSINQLLGTTAGAATLMNYQLGKNRAAEETRTNTRLEATEKQSSAIAERERGRIAESRLNNPDTLIGNIKQLGNEKASRRILDRADMQIRRSRAAGQKIGQKV